jgi:tetratricopeptide (TPR) repeat protein
MRHLALGCVALVVTLVTTAAVRAGVYNTAESEGVVDPDYRKFRDGLIFLRQNMSIGGQGVQDIKVTTPEARRYQLLAALAAESPAAKMDDETRLNLGAYLIRVGKYDAAGKVLNPLKFQDRKNFLAYSNLATADFLLGVEKKDLRTLDNASVNLGAALSYWPKDYSKLPEEKRKWLERIGWGEAQLKKFHRAEVYFQKLIRSRRQPTKHPLGDDVDALFGEPGKPVRFVGESGKYEAGKLAAAERAKLPPDALEIVEQLVLWMPQDMRLNWLLGELFNSQGDYEAALEIFKGIGVTSKYHHEVWGLFRYKAPGVTDLDTLGEIGSKNKPGYAPLLLEHIRVLLAHQEQQNAKLQPVQRDPQPPPQHGKTPTKPPETVGDDSLIDVRTLGVGFGIGLVVAFLGFWQYHEVRRRRQAANGGPQRVAPSPHVIAKPPH